MEPLFGVSTLRASIDYRKEFSVIGEVLGSALVTMGLVCISVRLGEIARALKDLANRR